MKYTVLAVDAADINQADNTTNWTMEAPKNGIIRLDECFLRWTEATGTQSTTQGVISIEVAGAEVATLTANISDAIGETQTFTESDNKYIDFAAGDDIEVITKTQAVGGTVTGDGDVYLSLEMSAN